MPGLRILAIETSCDETAVAIVEDPDAVLAARISSQIHLHQPYGGIVPEVASRNHNLALPPLLLGALEDAGLRIGDIDAFAATAGPGLASSLLIGNTTAKTLALSSGRPFLAVNHLEGHLLSPFIGQPGGIRPCLALVVSGGHTLLLQLRSAENYILLGQTRDDAAGEAFDKVAKMLGLPYPGGPEIDRLARGGNPAAYHFPRSMIDSQNDEFSFSGLKTAMLYTLRKINNPKSQMENLCASFQEAVVEVLVTKTLRATRRLEQRLVTLSGGVSCNSRLREAFADACQRENIELRIAPPELCTDNAVMIAFAASQKLARGRCSPLSEDIDPNLALA